MPRTWALTVLLLLLVTTGVSLRAAEGTDGSFPVIAAAGDVSCAPGDTTNPCRQRETSDLVLAGDYDAVLGLGDLQYEEGALAAFRGAYEPTWGRVKAVTRPATGNHEYSTRGAKGYFDYFGAAAGPRTRGWYSFDLGAWHLVALNSNCSAIGGCGAGSPQARWLRADLRVHRTRCTLAFWHHPRFSSGAHGSDARSGRFWDLLYGAGADIVLVGHDHDYERFAPQTPAGVRDLGRGIRQFVVGTGGKSLRPFGAVAANSVRRDATTFGVVELTLRPRGYTWTFVPAVGAFTDRGSGGLSLGRSVVGRGRGRPRPLHPVVPRAPVVGPTAAFCRGWGVPW